MPLTPTRARALRALEWAAALLVLAFLVRYVAVHWEGIAAHRWSLRPARLVLGSALALLAYSGFVLLWKRLLAVLGSPLSLVDAHRIWYFGNLGRYVPGKVLQLAGTAYLARAKGVSPVLAVAASLISQLFVVAAGGVLAAVMVPAAAGGEAAGIRAAGMAAGAVFALLVLTPLFGRVHRLALRLARRSEHWAPIRWRERAWLFAGAVLAWVALGGGFFFFLSSITPLPDGSFWPVAGICAAGYLAGWLAVFVPGGIGVREGVYALLLAQLVPGPVAAAAAILARLWLTLVELAAAAALAAVFGFSDLRAAAPSPSRSA